MADPINVRKGTPWKVNYNYYEGVTGIRTYYEDTNSDDELPMLGDKWDDDNESLTLKNLDVLYLNDDPTCIRKFICTYDTRPTLQLSTVISGDDLPTTIDATIEQKLWEPNPSDALWKWKDNDELCDQVLPKIVIHENFIQDRYIGVGNFAEYNAAVVNKLGKLNATSFRRGPGNSGIEDSFPIGTVMFTGAQFSEARNKIGARRWKVTLNFAIKLVTFEIGGSPAVPKDGWCFQLRKADGKWALPQYIDGTYTYSFEDFNPLFTLAPIGDDEEDIIDIVEN